MLATSIYCPARFLPAPWAHRSAVVVEVGTDFVLEEIFLEHLPADRSWDRSAPGSPEVKNALSQVHVQSVQAICNLLWLISKYRPWFSETPWHVSPLKYTNCPITACGVRWSLWFGVFLKTPALLLLSFQPGKIQMENNYAEEGWNWPGIFASIPGSGSLSVTCESSG